MERNDPPGTSRGGEDVTNEGGHYSSEKEVVQQAISYSRGSDKFDAYPEQRSAVSFAAFAEAVLSDRSTAKGLTWISGPFARNGDGRHHRCRDGSLPRQFLVFDLDGATPDGVDMLCMLLAEYSGFGYLTASHTTENPHARFILELSRQVDRDEGMRLGAAMQRLIEERVGATNVTMDPSVYRAEQPVYGPLIGAETMRYDGDPIDVDTVLATAPPIVDERPGLKERAAAIASHDPVVRVFTDRGMIKLSHGDAKLSIICPFEDSHTERGGETSTVYFLPNFGGVRYGKFVCLHRHCADRKQEDFLRALGLEPKEVWRGQVGGAAPYDDLPPVESYGGAAEEDARRHAAGTKAHPGQVNGASPAGARVGEEWHEPKPLTVKAAPEPYPLDALPDIIRAAVVEVQGFTKAPVPLVASAALGAVSIATQAHVDVKRAERLSGPSSLSLLCIADSGERKTTCDGFFMSAIREYEQKQAEAAKPELKRYAAKIAAWTAERDGILLAIKEASRRSKNTKALRESLAEMSHDKPEAPRVPKLLRVDDTPESLAWVLAKEWPSAGVASSDAGIVFGSHGMGKDSIMRNLSQLNILWDGGALSIGRRTKESFDVRGARLTMALQIQEATLRAFFDKSDGLPRGIGFLARFLVAWPESTQGFRLFTEAPEGWPALAAFHLDITKILDAPVSIGEDGGLRPVMLPLAPAAKAAWVAFHDAIEGELRNGGELYHVRDVASKTADNAARMAAQFQRVTHGIGDAVEGECFDRASRIVAWHLNESRRFFGELALPVELVDAARLDSWLIEHCRRERTQKVPTKKVQQFGPAGLREKAKIEAAVREIEELGRVRLVLDGRRKEIHVNPALLA